MKLTLSFKQAIILFSAFAICAWSLSTVMTGDASDTLRSMSVVFLVMIATAIGLGFVRGFDHVMNDAENDPLVSWVWWMALVLGFGFGLYIF